MKRIFWLGIALVYITIIFATGWSIAYSERNTLPTSVTNEGTPIKGGILKVALVKDEPFQGVFLAELYENRYDGQIMAYASNSIFETDGNFLINDEGIASLQVNREENKVRIKIRDGVRWSDGEPLKIEDLILPYEIIGHPDYTGVRYDTEFKNIIGAEEYHKGEAKTISGIRKIDDLTLEIRFKKLSPAIFSGGDGLWTYAAPSHQLKDIPVKKLIESDAVRKNPVTLGPFKFHKIIPGESVQFVKNEYYWKGEPKLDGVFVQVVPSSSISVAIGSGKYDIVSGFSATKWPEIQNYNNIDILGRPELYYSYLGFKLGKWDRAKRQVVTDLTGTPVGDKALRQAMGYALDVEAVNEVFYYHYRQRANSLIPPAFNKYHDATLEGYHYNPKKANRILDEAGYIDIDGDGFREDPKGKKLEIKFATMSGDTIQDEIAAYFLQNWRDVGLNVTLTTGRTMEVNSFYDKIEADDPEIHVFMAAWGTGSNPSPSGLYGKSDAFNFSRFTSDFLEETIQKIDSPEAFDADFRAEQFRKWQQYMAEEAPVIPLQFSYEIVPVNKRVKYYSIDFENPSELHEIELLAKEPVKSKKK